jgi:cysteine desulfurase/selenocysteine lyase
MNASIDINKIREDFPILSKKVYGKNLVYLDNAATTQKPKAVIDKIVEYYSEYNSNIHRGVHFLSQAATDEYEKAREIIRKYINADKSEEIIYTRGASEAINLVAASYSKAFISEGDEIIVSNMEHHSNIVPWQFVCEEKGAVLKVIPINDDGEIIYEEFEKLLSDKTKIVSIAHISNSMGTINPIKDIIKAAHKVGAIVVIDAAQSIQHVKVDVKDLDCDFLAFSGHKIYGPTGIGVLYGKKSLLDKMPPYQGGGDMIMSVSFEKTKYNVLPYKFEAGTPNIEGAIGLGAAIEYINSIGLDAIAAYEAELLKYATEQAIAIPELRIIGTAKNKASVLSFVLSNIHPHDIGTLLDRDGIAVRAGQHCTEPLMARFCIPATTRASFAFYNTKEEIDALFASVKKVIKMFS